MQNASLNLKGWFFPAMLLALFRARIFFEKNPSGATTADILSGFRIAI